MTCPCDPPQADRRRKRVTTRTFLLGGAIIGRVSRLESAIRSASRTPASAITAISFGN